ncbi:hypothetical protein [Pseudomonas gingeri]
MGFQHVDQSCQQQMDGARNQCETIHAYCGYLLGGLHKFFTHEHAQANYGVVFTVNEYLSCGVKTPYGVARGRLALQLVDGEMVGRYVFEKSVVSKEGLDVWVPIWAIRIGRNGNVWLGDEGDVEIDVSDSSPFNKSFSVTAKSLLHRIATTSVFQ